MEDARFSAQLKAAKLTAKSEEDKTIRRVQFQLAREFSVEIAEWLGDVALNQRALMIAGDVDKCELPIDAYHAKAELAGLGGTASVFVDGISATASVKQGKEDEPQHEEVAFVFEAFPDAKLLTFLAATLKEYVDCDFKRTQLSIEECMAEPSARLRSAVDDMKAGLKKGESLTIMAVNPDGSKCKSATIEGTGKARNGGAGDSKQ
jgi:hypothetical protein